MSTSQRGATLAAVLLAMALLLPLGALALLQARSGFLVQQSLTGDVEALHAADGGLACALAALPPLADDALLLRGPDAQAGTADDGLFPFPRPCATAEVRIASTAGGRWLLRSTGRGMRGAARDLELTLERSALPFTPAAVARTGGAPPMLDPGCLMSGDDHTAADALGSPSGGASAVAVLASWDATAVATAARQRPDAVTYGYGSLPADARLGEAETPSLSIVDGDLEVSGDVAGHGVLVVEGRLRLRGALRFQGLVVASAGIIAEAGSGLEIRGALWPGAGPLEMLCGGGVAYCAGCLAAADAALPGLLPHGFAVTAWREP